MAEISTLGIKIDGVAGIDRAASSLDDLSDAASGAEKGMGGAGKASASLGNQAKAAAKSISTMALAAASAASAAGIALVKSQIDLSNELRIQSQLSNATTTEFQRLAVAAGTVGINQEKLSDQLKDFNEKLGEFQQSGGGGMLDFFEQVAPQIDITAEAFRGLSGPQALQLYYDSLEKAGLSQQQMSFYLESMASDTTALIPLLRNGGEAMAFLADEAERAGAIMSEDAISSADRLASTMWIAEQSVDGLKIK